MFELIFILLALILALCFAPFLFKLHKTKSGAAERNKPIYYSAENAVQFLKQVPNIKEILSGADTIMTYDQIPARIPYESSKSIIKTTLHNGQLKLFLTELEFLTEYANNGPAICVYAGSAPSNKINFLAGMFPDIKFILIDPHEHYIMFPGNDDQYSDANISKCLYFRAMQTPQFAPKNARVQTWANG